MGDATEMQSVMDAIRARHSVRQYIEKPLAPHIVAALRRSVNECNAEGGLNFQLVVDEPDAFSGFLAHYGTFRGVRNYVAVVGKEASDLDERCGYYGEKIVIQAQRMGLNTCWVALTYRKIPGAFHVGAGEKVVAVIALGEGVGQGKPRRSKEAGKVSRYIAEDGSPAPAPEWFKRGVEAALLAPTAVNQQKFMIEGCGDRVSLMAGKGPCVRIDLGIVRYHFECGAYPHSFEWV